MKNYLSSYNLFAIISLIAVTGAAHPQNDLLSVVKSSYHGKSEEVMELFRDLGEGLVRLTAKPHPDGLRIAPYADFGSWDEFSPGMKDFLQCLLDEVVANQLNVVADAQIFVWKYSGKPSTLSSHWHVDGSDEHPELRSIPLTLISFSNSQNDLATRFSTVTPPIAAEDYETIEDHLIEGIREGDFASGDLHLIYHRGPTKSEMGSSQRLFIEFVGKVFSWIQPPDRNDL